MKEDLVCMIDVFVVTYNRANFLKIALQSILDQTYSDFELTILDNCSTDNTEEICKSFADPRIHYVKREENIGGLANIQDALKRSNKKYFVVFHDDDIMLPDFLAYEVSYLERNQHVCAISGNILNISESVDCMPVGKGQILKDNFDYTIKLYKGTELFESYLSSATFVFFPTVMYRTEFVRENEVNLIPEAGPSADILLFFEMLRKGGILAISQKPVEAYRRHQGQESQENRVEMVRQLFEFLSRDSYYKQLLEENRYVLKKCYYRYLFNEVCLFCDKKIDILELKNDMTVYERVFYSDAHTKNCTRNILGICTIFPLGVRVFYIVLKGLKEFLKKGKR